MTMETEGGITGEYSGGVGVSYAQVAMAAQYLIGKNALQRELIWNDLKRALRKHDRFGIGPIDCALGDIAGKAYGVPGVPAAGRVAGKALPAYASTFHGDENGGPGQPRGVRRVRAAVQGNGLSGVQDPRLGHGPIQREAKAVLATRKAVGAGMDLMIDPGCEYENWGDALKVGQACDEANYFWYEDPYKDGGLSAYAHKRLREFIKTPILMGEHIRGMELPGRQPDRRGHRFRARRCRL